MNKVLIAIIILIISILSGVISIIGYSYYEEKIQTKSISKEGNNEADPSGIDSSLSNPGNINFIEAAYVATPAVVHIKTFQKSASVPYSQNPFDEMLRDYFGDNLPQRELPPRQSSGSGVILSDDGFIVTNNHVISGSNKIEVVLSDKRSYIATLVGVDPNTDLALLKIQEKGLPFIRYGNSETLRIGSWVLAVGNPFNLNSTVTAGIVSAKGRSINILREENDMAIESFIQTDAVVNPGNSGGALVNLKGELVGINTAIASPTGVFAGYAFAVPETLVKKVVGDLSKYGAVQRAFLGVVISDINAAVAKEIGIKEIAGVYIASVKQGSAADKAGIREGDIIREINGRKVNSASRLQELVATLSPGDKINITYLRNGEVYTAQATLQNKRGDTRLIKGNSS